MNEKTASSKPAEATPFASLCRWWRVAVVVVVVAGLILTLRRLPAKQYLQSLLEWAQGLGVWAPLFVVVFYIFACVLFLPGSVLTLGAGFLFGVIKGTITVSVGSTLGACAAFLVGRTIARDWVAGKVAGNAKFAAIDEAVGHQGFKIVLLTRLSPLFPFNLLNYAFGLTKAPFTSYALASWIGMLPGTVMYVYLGSAARSLATAAAGTEERGLPEQIFFWFGLAIAVAVAVVVTRIARGALKRAAQQAGKATSQQYDPECVTDE